MLQCRKSDAAFFIKLFKFKTQESLSLCYECYVGICGQMFNAELEAQGFTSVVTTR